MNGQQGAQVSRRAAVLFTLLPAFAGAAQAKGDATAAFKTEIAGKDGNGVAISFVYPTAWKLEEKPGPILMTEATIKACSEDPDECDKGEIIARSIATGDNALVLAFLTNRELGEIPFSFFKNNIFGRGGKFGAYGEPEVVKTVSDKTQNGVRTLDIKWNTFTPGGTTLAKRSVVTAVAGEDEVYILVCSASAKSWKSSEDVLRGVSASWKATPTGKSAEKRDKVGIGQSMFKKQNEERKALQKEREEEGIF